MKYISLLIILAGFLVACSKHEPAQSQDTAQKQISRTFDYAQLQQGEQLFRAHCAQCHGQNAEGTANWRQVGVDGKYPPPPLNGTAHAWHHPSAVLKDVIKNGSIRMGGNMPAWKDRLSDSEIADIIAWFQAKWPDEVYAAWLETEQRSLSEAAAKSNQ